MGCRAYGESDPCVEALLEDGFLEELLCCEVKYGAVIVRHRFWGEQYGGDSLEFCNYCA